MYSGSARGRNGPRARTLGRLVSAVSRPCSRLPAPVLTILLQFGKLLSHSLLHRRAARPEPLRPFVGPLRFHRSVGAGQTIGLSRHLALGLARALQGGGAGPGNRSGLPTHSLQGRPLRRSLRPTHRIGGPSAARFTARRDAPPVEVLTLEARNPYQWRPAGNPCGHSGGRPAGRTPRGSARSPAHRRRHLSLSG